MATVSLRNFLVILFSGLACAQQYNGIIGFGIPLWQDVCCRSCSDSFSSLYLNCTTFDDDTSVDSMDMDTDSTSTGTTSMECYETNLPWLQSMAYCLQQKCPADGYGTTQQAACFSTYALMGEATPTFLDSLPDVAPTVMVEEDAVWLNVTSLVNADAYYSTHGTYSEFIRSEYIHTRYAVILYFTVIGACLGTGLFSYARGQLSSLQKALSTSSLWAKLQSRIFMPALFGARRLESLPGKLGYVPGRTLSIFITIYIIMNIILCSVSFRSFQPNVFWSTSQVELCEYIGNRTGIFSLVNMSIAILFAGRNNLLIGITGWNQTAFLTLHRWAARVATIQAVVHSICYTIQYLVGPNGGAAAYAVEAALPFYWWGIIGTIALCLIVAFAVLPLRTRLYEFFLLTHIALVILALVACWYHLVPHFGYAYGYQVWLYICFAFWSADRLARFTRVLYYNRLGNATADVQTIPGSSIMQVTIYPRVGWDFGPGQHTFLYLPALGRFWESHPFSVAAWTELLCDCPPKSDCCSPKADCCSSPASDMEIIEAGEISAPRSKASISQTVSLAEDEKPSTACSARYAGQPAVKFMVRAHSGITSSLLKRLQRSGSSMEMSIYSEGPYAGHRATTQPLNIADTVLCLVGGIGITNALGFVQEFANARRRMGRSSGATRGIMRNAKRFILAWSAKEIGLIEHVKSDFLVHLDDAGQIEYAFWCTGDSNTVEENVDGKEMLATTTKIPKITAGRMDVGDVLRSSLETGFHTTVLVCGPGNMIDEATREIVECVKEGHRVDMIEEAYAW
ncbi:ferric reductase like transmembrane component-domain-containing protein [Calycina marina]|uniref:Ferric reductase like transmembrane component-domain-containing protein n=1 Tax=Calycina marina TaxID=1763456 RepID=A0A9P7YXY6_9HELO|nr:ferric reductase like transmembrane component-domain-containing protein [Calycina marina]